MPYNKEELWQKAREIVLPKYHDLLNMFSKHDSNIIAPYCYYDYKIKLIEGKQLEDLGFALLYKQSLKELEECQKYIIKALKKGFIKISMTS